MEARLLNTQPVSSGLVTAELVLPGGFVSWDPRAESKGQVSGEDTEQVRPDESPPPQVSSLDQMGTGQGTAVVKDGSSWHLWIL